MFGDEICRVDFPGDLAEVDPADLFTKHSLTRDRLMKLSELFKVEFRGGRAESAPQTRCGTGKKSTLAEVLGVGGGHGSEGEQRPTMPHLEHTAQELDRLYPSVVAAEAVDDDEDDGEPLLVEGLRIARMIAQDASHHGRRRQGCGQCPE